MTDSPSAEPGSTADICVVGGGPAGLVLASSLTARGQSVTLLESGGPSSGSDDLNRTEVTGDPINALDPVATRFRGLGGSANQWAVKTRRQGSDWIFGLRFGAMTGHSLRDRPWIGASGWPIDGDELQPWYRAAHALLAEGDFDYADAGPDGDQVEWLGLDDIDRRGFRFGPRDRFLVDLRASLENDQHIRIVEGATVTRLHQPTAGGPVTHLSFTDEQNRPHDLRARTVVLAGGGIENARLLLNSEADRGGIGNESDNVGRYFMDHPLYSIGDIRLTDQDMLRNFTYFDLHPDSSGPRHGHVVTSGSWCESNRSVEIAAAFFPRHSRGVTVAVESARALATNPRHFASNPKALARSVARVLPGLRALPWAMRVSLGRKQSLLPGFGRGGWSEDPTGLGFSELEVVFQCEQVPLRDSRVTLTNRRDRLGMPIPRIEWRLGDQTRDSVLAFQRLIANRVHQSSIGTYIPRAETFDRLNPPTSIAHHLGTTRMSADPANGVVDTACRVHTAPNLFIVGGSVFPVGGYVNPTLTIAALALRLADHLATARSN